MRSLLIAIATFLLFSLQMNAQQAVHIIPQPNKLAIKTGSLTLPASFSIASPKNKEWKHVANMLVAQFEQAADLDISVRKKNAFITFEKVKTAALGEEGYQLDVNESQVIIKANTAKGAFYGMQTLLQLLPAQIYGNTKQSASFAWHIPQVSIEDVPRFAYRGLHLDVARHFFSVDFIKRYIDLMAMHKKNQFHWHLTDDQGWRIEIKKYPKLTEVGAYRAQTNGDGKPYGAFYTQAEIKEVVAYAQSKFINVIPEIEMPGHATAALAAYPRYGNDSTRKYQVATTFGILHDVFMPYEHTFTFLKDVLKEVMDLFPGEYIHIGGDECPKGQWNASPFAKSLMQQLNLKNANELQSYFIKRIDTFLTAHNKKMIGWEEIAEGGLSPNAIVMSWKGEHAARESIMKGHKAILSPTQFCYLDYAQAEILDEPLAYPRLLPLEQVYKLDPAPQSIPAEQLQYVLGVQGNLWTEYNPTNHKAEYQLWPRAAAIAEIGWTLQALRDINDFKARWEIHKLRMDQLGVNYYGAPINGNFEYQFPPNSKRYKK